MTTVARLPRGRHGLSREQVVGAQRGRMFSAMAEAMAVRGYVETSVAEIIRRAGVSRETFYQQFSSKQDCFVQALDAAADDMIAALTATDPCAGTPLEVIGGLLDAYFDIIVTHPSTARVLLIDVYAAGPEAMKRRAVVTQRFVDLVVSILQTRSERDRFACQALVAAISSMVTTALAGGDLHHLPALRAPLVDLASRIIDLS